MNDKLSYVVQTNTTFQNAVTQGEVFEYSITLTTGLSGLIRNDSYLRVTFKSSAGSTYTTEIPCYVDDVLITEHTFGGLTLNNTENTNSITGIELAFDYLDDVWRNINFVYKGAITEQIKLVVETV